MQTAQQVLRLYHRRQLLSPVGFASTQAEGTSALAKEQAATTAATAMVSQSTHRKLIHSCRPFVEAAAVASTTVVVSRLADATKLEAVAPT